MRIAVVMFVIALLASAAAGLGLTQAAPGTQWYAVPGRSIGSLRVGMPIEEAVAVMARLGNVQVVSERDGSTWWCNSEDDQGFCVADGWAHRDNSQATQTSGRVYMISSNDTRVVFAFSTGVKSVLGSSYSEWAARLGAADYVLPGLRRVFYEWKRGVGIKTFRSGEAVAVFVFKPE